MACRVRGSMLSLAVALIAVRQADATVTRRFIDFETVTKNPIRKVVQLLENMAKRIAAEGEQEKELYDKFSCYCQTGQADLQQSITSNDAKVPALQNDIESAESSVAKLKQDLKQHQLDRESANKALAEATALREKDHANFLEESSELQGYVDALGKAIPAVRTGMAGTRLLQVVGTSVSSLLRRAASSDGQLTDDDRGSVVAFLSQSNGVRNSYIPGSGEVLGILTNMQADFEKNLAEVTGTEEEAQQLFDDLVAAKAKEVETLGASIERKTAKVGELQIQVVHMKQDLTEAEALLIEDQKFLKELSGSCDNKKADWDERQKVRAEELVAIHDTIKILNDDDALDVFRKTLQNPSSSFVQLTSERERIQQKALALVKRLRAPSSSPKTNMAFADLDRPEVRFLEVALQGGKVDFSKVVKMIDDMVVLLAKEQTDDDGKREYCRKQIDNVEDKAKELEKGIEDHEITIEDETETIATLSEEISTLKADITELDKLVQESTEQRKNENAEFTQLMSENTEATQLLKYAQSRLHKFYNPSLHNAESSKKGDEEEGTNAAALLQKETTSLHATGSHRADPGVAPTTWDGYATKAEESNSVISMIELLVRDLTKEMTMAQATEEHSQKGYEGFMQASAGKRAKTVKAVSIKNAAKADCEVAKTAHEADKKEATGKLEATRTYELQLHTECDWLVQNYDLRRTARADEIDTLKQAKAVLQGADFSLVQGSRSGFLGHRSI